MTKEINDSLKDLLDEFHYHEATDRLHIVMSTIDDHLIQHPVCKLYKEISNRIEQAQSLLFEAYQMVGQKNIEKKLTKKM